MRLASAVPSSGSWSYSQRTVGGSDIKMPIDIKITNIIFSVETELYNNVLDIPDNGGSIFLGGPSGGGLMITFTMANVLFKGLRSNYFGGAVCVGGNVQVELDNVRFEDCIANGGSIHGGALALGSPQAGLCSPN